VRKKGTVEDNITRTPAHYTPKWSKSNEAAWDICNAHTLQRPLQQHVPILLHLQHYLVTVRCAHVLKSYGSTPHHHQHGCRISMADRHACKHVTIPMNSEYNTITHLLHHHTSPHRHTSPPGARRQPDIHYFDLLVQVNYMPPGDTMCHTGVLLQCSSRELTSRMDTAAPCCCVHRAAAATKVCVRRAGNKLCKAPHPLPQS
jgi:hypothetical protein